MIWLVSLLMRSGLGQQAAGLVAKGLLALLVAGVLWGAYEGLWAAPRRQAAQAQQALLGCTSALGEARGAAGRWQAAAGACSTATAALQARCTAEAATAGQRAREALLAAQGRHRALLADPATGPAAMNHFMQEVYQ